MSAAKNISFSQSNLESKIDFSDNELSSLNNYFLCNYCGTDIKFQSKLSIIEHMKLCCGNTEIMYYKYIKQTKIPRFCLGNERFFSSNEKKIKKSHCYVCDRNFSNVWDLRYHIRQTHFNLKARSPYCDIKKINQVWFEKVQNTNYILEIKKTGQNSLSLRRMNENTAIKVLERHTEVIDLDYMYPTTRQSTKKSPSVYVECELCKKKFLKRYLLCHKLKKHGKKSV
ncbi:uncharacterized protein ACR2FA_011063 [Aphomia sociella]